MAILTISGVSTQATEIMAIMQANHITMSHEFIEGKYSSRESGTLLIGCLLFSFTTTNTELEEMFRNDSSVYDLHILEG